jgi:PAS domain S-box-containing protein
MLPPEIKILLVEDNPGDARLIIEMLGSNIQFEHSVSVAADLKSAAADLCSSVYDIIILDLNLPDSSGLSTLDNIVKSTRRLIPVIVLTGVDDEDIGLSSIEGGAEDYLIKGDCDPPQFLRSIKYAIERKQMMLKLINSERRLKEAQSVAKVGDWEFDIASQKLIWSDQVYRMYERDPSLGPPVLEEEAEYYTPEQAEMLKKTADEVIGTGEKINYNLRANLPGGSSPVFAGSMRPVRNASGSITGLIGTIQDITEQVRADEDIRESELRYRTLADSGQALIWTSGLDKKCNYFNLPWLAFSGRTIEQEMGDGWTEGVHPDDLNACFDTYAGAFDKREPFSMTYRLRRNDGVYRWIIDDGMPRYDTKQNFLGYIGHCLDITARKVAEDALRENSIFMSSLLEAIPAPVFYKDTEERYIGFNKAFENFYGRTIDELVGKNVFELFPKSLAEIYHQKDSHLFLNPGIQIYDSQIEDAGGGLHDVVFHKATFTDAEDNIRGLIGVILDITDRKLAEEKLAKLNMELEEHVARRTLDLENANKELESFSYTVSHDLRAPLRHINGFLEMLKRELGALPGEKAEHYMKVVNESAAHMGTLIDDLLSFSRMGKADLVSKTVNIEALVNDCLETFSEEILQRGIKISIKPLLNVQADSALIQVVLMNLISNAVKFTAKSPAPEIEIGAEASDSGKIFYIRDNGSGFDMRYADKLFGVFQRLHTGNEFEGTGIGLATVKRIINRHGGRVWAESEIGKGAVFYFSIPDNSDSNRKKHRAEKLYAKP